MRDLDMRMEDPIPTFTYVVEKLKEKHPELAYIHVVAPTGPGGVGPTDPAVSYVHCTSPVLSLIDM